MLVLGRVEGGGRGGHAHAAANKYYSYHNTEGALHMEWGEANKYYSYHNIEGGRHMRPTTTPPHPELA